MAQRRIQALIDGCCRGLGEAGTGYEGLVVTIAHIGWVPAEELFVTLAATGTGLVIAARAALRRLRQDVRSG